MVSHKNVNYGLRVIFFLQSGRTKGARLMNGQTLLLNLIRKNTTKQINKMVLVSAILLYI